MRRTSLFFTARQETAGLHLRFGLERAYTMTRLQLYKARMAPFSALTWQMLGKTLHSYSGTTLT